jgi:hypothetical protein
VMNETYTITVPMSFRRIGGRKTIILPDGGDGSPMPKPPIEDALVKAVVRAYRWQKLLESGDFGSLAEIARAEKISLPFVSQVYRLALLGPEIVEAILRGRAPAHLTFKGLLAPFPVVWAGQRLQYAQT